MLKHRGYFFLPFVVEAAGIAPFEMDLQVVRKVFVRWFDEGLIYRGNRIINWCPRCHTAISEIEVEYEDEQGELVHIEYPFVDGPGPNGAKGITVATTRAARRQMHRSSGASRRRR